MEPVYRYRAFTERVVDGDTLHLRVDLGFRASLSIPVRLYGINCPERGTEAGDAATAFVRELLAPANLNLGPPTPLMIESYRDRQSFARWVCEVFFERGGEFTSLAAELLNAGHAEVATP